MDRRIMTELAQMLADVEPRGGELAHRREPPPRIEEPGIRRFLRLSTPTGSRPCACGCGSPVAANKEYKFGHAPAVK